MALDAEAPEEVAEGTVGVGSPCALERLPTRCRWDLWSTDQGVLGEMSPFLGASRCLGLLCSEQ